MLRSGRAVGLLIISRVTSPKLNAVRPRGPLIRRHRNHSQKSLVRDIMRHSVLNTLSWHYVLAMSHCELSLPFPRVMGLSHSFLVPASTAAFVTWPMRLKAKSPTLLEATSWTCVSVPMVFVLYKNSFVARQFWQLMSFIRPSPNVLKLVSFGFD